MSSPRALAYSVLRWGAIPGFELSINMGRSKYFQEFILAAAGRIDFSRVESSLEDQ